IEFRPGFEAMPGMSFFLDGQVGEDNHHSVLAGVRFYFGESTTLIDRHRRDDFINLTAFLKSDNGEGDKYIGNKGGEAEYESEKSPVGLSAPKTRAAVRSQIRTAALFHARK